MNVSITTASVKDALVVPVNALLALGSGGYAVEAVGAGGAHHLVAVQLGLFDDADGLVQVTGCGLAPGSAWWCRANEPRRTHSTRTFRSRVATAAASRCSSSRT